MLGPDDLKLSLGLDVDASVLETPELQQALKTIANAAALAGKHFCCITPTEEMTQLAMRLSCQMYIGGGDSGVYGRDPSVVPGCCNRFGSEQSRDYGHSARYSSLFKWSTEHSRHGRARLLPSHSDRENSRLSRSFALP